MATKKHVTTDLMIAKLESSGLSAADAEKLGMTYLQRQQVTALDPSFSELASLRIGYYGIDGKPISDWPQGAPFYRLRYLETPQGFAAQTTRKMQRYAQPARTAPVAYYPRNIDWNPLVKDTERDVIITEGELKAAKACKEGFHTIGLGGVHNWHSNRMGLAWLESLDYLDWKRRRVLICFDSDYRENPHIATALHQLSEALHERGALSHIVSLPSIAGLDKVGLDDYFVSSGPGAKARFKALLDEAEPLGLTQPLWGLNKSYLFVRDPGMVVQQSDGTQYDMPKFQMIEGARVYHANKMRADGTVSHARVSATDAWIKWPLRREVDILTYAPGKPRLITTPRAMYNLWSGWGVEPQKGNVKRFTDLVSHLFTGAGTEARDWFLRWLAYPLQHPGTKMYTAVVVHGRNHGTGKSLLGATMGRIYGESNYATVGRGDLHSSFNDWADSKQFVMGDDVAGSDKRADIDFLKKLITQETIRINKKYVPAYVVPDCVNYYFTSNNPDSFYLDDDDRRFFVHQVQVEPLPMAFYGDYADWLSNGGASAIYQYLLELPMGDFNPAARALYTAAKAQMTDIGHSDLGRWVRDMLESPDYVLRVGGVGIPSQLMTSIELLNIYDPTGGTRVTSSGIGRELARVGATVVLSGRRVRLSDGSRLTYYAVRRAEYWATASEPTVRKYLEGVHQVRQPGNLQKPAKY